MSDNDDRLDRAERIRRMRENRGDEESGDGGQDADGGSDDGNGDSADQSGEAEPSSEQEEADLSSDQEEADPSSQHEESDPSSEQGEADRSSQSGEAGSEPGLDDAGSGGEPSESPERGDWDPATEDDSGDEESAVDRSGDGSAAGNDSGTPSATEDDSGTPSATGDDTGTPSATGDDSSTAPVIEAATGGSSAGQEGGTADADGATAGTAPTQVTEEMTAAEVARIVGQQGSRGQETAAKGFGRGQADDEIALRAGSITGETIVDDSFFEEGGRAQIIEFSIGAELFAIDVGFVGEIIETPEVTRIPNTPDCVQGVVDLRGKVTAVMDPTPVLASDASLVEEALVVVLDSDAIEYDGTVGWLVDDVRQVSTISASQVTDPPERDEWVRGVVDREDEDFVIWADPTAVLEEVDTTGIDDDSIGERTDDAQ